MAELEARSAGADVFPVAVGDLRAAERVPGPLWSVMPLAGADAGGLLGCDWPVPGRVVEGAGMRAIWFGRDAVMVEGPRPAGLEGRAAVVDQGDAWCVVRLEGRRAEDVLARLVPLDLRDRAFPDGSVARTLVGHVSAAVLRRGAEFELWVFRSMAVTLAHELGRAMRGVAARPS